MVERLATVHLIDEPAGTRATRTACGARLSAAGRVFRLVAGERPRTIEGAVMVSEARELVTCHNCARLPSEWRGLERYNYRATRSPEGGRGG